MSLILEAGKENSRLVGDESWLAAQAPCTRKCGFLVNEALLTPYMVDRGWQILDWLERPKVNGSDDSNDSFTSEFREALGTIGSWFEPAQGWRIVAVKEGIAPGEMGFCVALRGESPPICRISPRNTLWGLLGQPRSHLRLGDTLKSEECGGSGVAGSRECYDDLGWRGRFVTLKSDSVGPYNSTGFRGVAESFFIADGVTLRPFMLYAPIPGIYGDGHGIEGEDPTRCIVEVKLRSLIMPRGDFHIIQTPSDQMS